jgi:hypothetical protein
MANVIIVRAKSENKSWIINLDDETSLEVENEAAAEFESRLSDAGETTIVEARAYAACHGWSEA